MVHLLGALLASFLLLSPSWAGAQGKIEGQKAKDSYSLGYEFGNNLKAQEVDVDAEVLLTAIRDGLQGKESALSAAEIREDLLQLRKQVMLQQENRHKEQVAKNLQAGKAFLESNKSKEGVTTLPSGLQYKVLREGNGPCPQTTDTVKVHYIGTLVDGTEFDSSYKRGAPATLPVKGVIKGWTEALPLMKTGAKWQLFIPAELAYGERQFGRIPPNSTLIFEMELLAIGEEAAKTVEPKPQT